MTTSPALVVSGCVAALVLMSIGSVVILQAQARQDRLRLRITNTVAPHQRNRTASALATTSGVGLVADGQGLGPTLAKLFGFDPRVPDHYLLRWWVALIATLIVSLLSAKILYGLAGNVTWFAVPVE